MPESLTPQNLETQLAVARDLVHRLVLVAGTDPVAKCRLLREAAEIGKFPVLNVGEQLAKSLMQLSVRQRPGRAAQELSSLLSECRAEMVALDHIEILFAPELRLDVVRLLQTLSRNTTLLVAWPGDVSDVDVGYAPSDHPEHQRSSLDGAVVASMSS